MVSITSLVVAYSILEKTTADITKDPLGLGKNNKEVYLEDIWPSPKSVNNLLDKIGSDLYVNRYKKIGQESPNWEEIETIESSTFNWNVSSTYVQNPPFLSDNSLTEVI